MKSKYIPDVEAVLARRRDNHGDYWARADGHLAVGAPFTTRYREVLETLQR